MRGLVLRRIVLHDIGIEPPAARLAREFLQHAFRAGAPSLDLDAVFVGESRHDDRQVGVHVVDGELALVPGGRHQTFLTVRTLVRSHLCDG